MGDGVLARFGSALDAVHAAIMIQKEAHEELDEKIRIGIHLGDVTLDSGDVFGDGVNIASRLQSIADPGGIYISESMHAAIGSNREIESTYIGEVLLKNVKAPLKTYYIEESWLPCPSKAKIRSITAQKKPLTSIKSRVVVAFVVVVLGLLYFSRPFWLGVAGKGLDSP